MGPQFRFEFTHFRASLVINGIKKMAHLVMLFIFYVNVITCQNFNLPQIYRIFVEKNHLLK
jgi:hypothetical protein